MNPDILAPNLTSLITAQLPLSWRVKLNKEDVGLARVFYFRLIRLLARVFYFRLIRLLLCLIGCRFISWGGHRQPTAVFLPGESMDRGTWQATVHGVTKSQTRLSNERHRRIRVHQRNRTNRISSWPWTTRVWDAQVYLYMDFSFFFSINTAVLYDLLLIESVNVGSAAMEGWQ